MDVVALLPDRQLVELALDGERQAINYLISRYQNKITQQIRAQISDYAIASDLAQEVSIKIFRYISHFKHDCSFATWLYKITQNTIKNYFRAMNDELNRTCYFIVELEDNNDSPESYLIGLQLSQRMDEIFSHMSHELYHCFKLYAVRGLSYEEIAKYLCCPVGTVRSRIHRVRNILMENLIDSR